MISIFLIRKQQCMQYCPEFDIMLLDMYEMNENRILIGEYQMANKGKLNKEERKRRRLQKGKQWLLTYQGTPKHMVKHYRERFHVDSMTAVKDLQELGVNYTQEQLDNIKRAEEERLKQKRLQKEKRNMKSMKLYMRIVMIVLHLSPGIRLEERLMVLPGKK